MEVRAGGLWPRALLLLWVTGTLVRGSCDAAVVHGEEGSGAAASFYPPFAARRLADPSPRGAIQGDREERRAFLALPLVLPIHAYRRFGRSLVKSRCPMAPTCSAYALDAYRRWGPVSGSLLTADRLFRCGHDRRWYERKKGWRDPVPGDAPP